MNFKAAVFLAALLPLAGCTDKQSDGFNETPECMKYRSMMTAPLPPDQSEKLRKACMDSRR
ncbi:hypothetical protein [Ochrobactrum sp. S1502_03]|uniref:hypothetical protein n=1 Tax=Ochrobactrum sp. S1502_03 TaxID=3108451 RepID=UPI0037CC41CA